jgi:cysteinyl-tRNA synthetase
VPDANVSLDTELDAAIQQECQEVYDGLNADFNTAMSIAALYNLLKRINSFKAKLLALNSISQSTFEKLVQTFVSINEEVLGISESKMLEGASPIAMLDAWMESYQQARTNKDFALVDTIRANFKANQIIIKDSKEGSEWAYEE